MNLLARETVAKVPLARPRGLCFLVDARSPLDFRTVSRGYVARQSASYPWEVRASVMLLHSALFKATRGSVSRSMSKLDKLREPTRLLLSIETFPPSKYRWWNDDYHCHYVSRIAIVRMSRRFPREDRWSIILEGDCSQKRTRQWTGRSRIKSSFIFLQHDFILVHANNLQTPRHVRHENTSLLKILFDRGRDARRHLGRSIGG